MLTLAVSPYTTSCLLAFDSYKDTLPHCHLVDMALKAKTTRAFYEYCDFWRIRGKRNIVILGRVARLRPLLPRAVDFEIVSVTYAAEWEQISNQVLFRMAAFSLVSCSCVDYR